MSCASSDADVAPGHTAPGQTSRIIALRVLHAYGVEVPPRSVPRLLARICWVASSLVALTLVSAGPAAAHTDRGVAGSNFAGRVLATSESMPGVTVQVAEFGDSLELFNRSPVTVTVYGYSDEEYLRIGPGGVWRNANSPATYINLRRDGDTRLPPNADPRSAPDWRQVSTKPEYAWHDHRTHWMLQSVPPQVAADPGNEHLIISWRVPLAYGDATVAVDGELTWSPPPNGALWWPLYLLMALAGLAAGLVARTARPLAGLLSASTAAAVWHLVATPQPGLTAVDRALAMTAASLPTLVLAGVAAIGVRAAFSGRAVLAGMLAGVTGFMLLVQGLPDVDVLWSANVITGGPVMLARLTVALLIFGGLGLMAGAAVVVHRFRPHMSSPGGPEAQSRGRAPTA